MANHRNAVFFAAVLCATHFALTAEAGVSLSTSKLLAEAREPLRIVCFGDSITGAYYHSGNRRAWPEMLKVALDRL